MTAAPGLGGLVTTVTLTRRLGLPGDPFPPVDPPPVDPQPFPPLDPDPEVPIPPGRPDPSPDPGLTTAR